LGSDGIKKEVTKAVVSKAQDLVKENTGVDLPTSKEELNEEALEKAREEADNLLAEAQKQADKVKLEAKKAADNLRGEAKIQNDKLVKEAGNNIFKKTAADVAGKKLIQEADKNAIKIEAEGTTQADKIMATAKEKAAALIKKAESK
jgi:regulator of protease activity HflC (stomatin/prohibitin superfamily)